MSYRTLLLLYPREFRNQFGDEIETDLRLQCEEARATPGRAALLRCYGAIVVDLAVSSAREWLRTPWLPVLFAAALFASAIFYYVVGRIYRARSFATASQPPESPELLLLMALMVIIPAAGVIFISLAACLVSTLVRGTRRRV